MCVFNVTFTGVECPKGAKWEGERLGPDFLPKLFSHRGSCPMDASTGEAT